MPTAVSDRGEDSTHGQPIQTVRLAASRQLLRRARYALHARRGLFFPHFVNDFYSYHQQHFRGDSELVKERQRTYLTYVSRIPQQALHSFPFLECGFGRGEFLELLREHGVPHIIGVDSNRHSVAHALKRSFQVTRDDVIRYLYTHDDQFCGVSAFHLIEHLTFEKLFDFVMLCHQRLTDGGILILETPNIKNVSISSTLFYYDPTHIQKVPNRLLKVVLKYVGFVKITSLYLNPTGSRSRASDLGTIAYKRANKSITPSINA